MVSPGIALHPLSAFSSAPEPLYRADRESAVDEPGPTDISGMTMESWCRLIWEQPNLDRELGVAAVAGRVVAAATFLFADHETGRAMNGGTGVVRAYRGRGLGLLVKQRSLAWAAAAGITRVITQNDTTNAPMSAINRKLGYTPPLRRAHVGARALTGPAGRAPGPAANRITASIRA